MKFSVSVFVAALALVFWNGSRVSAADGHDIKSVNGSVNGTAGETYGELSAVNGNVRVGRGTTADEAKTVNGGITVEDEAKLGEVSTVNGSLRIGEGVTIERTASTVNGHVALGKRTRVKGDVSTVSGEIEIHGAEVGGKLTTRNGDIDLTDGARVLGGILVKKNNVNSWFSGDKSDPPTVHICSTCVVEGELRFERPVELRVDQGAKIGKVIGDSVTRR